MWFLTHDLSGNNKYSLLTLKQNSEKVVGQQLGAHQNDQQIFAYRDTCKATVQSLLLHAFGQLRFRN